jgi:hypothetical protein
MKFLELKEQFESKLPFNFEVLEVHYVPYSFGSGLVAYKTKGKIVKIVYDGKVNQLQLLISTGKDKYPNASYTTIYEGLPTDFFESGVVNFTTSMDKELKQKYKADFVTMTGYSK